MRNSWGGDPYCRVGEVIYLGRAGGVVTWLHAEGMHFTFSISRA